MKRLFFSLSFCIILLVSTSALAQAAADYYLPLRVGNFLEFSTPNTPNGWGARTTRYSIERTDIISTDQYFKEIGIEIDQTGTNAFRVLWLRKDSGGNILAGAMGSVNLVFNPPFSFFPNGFLVANYSRTYPDADFNGEEKTLSINETVIVEAGTFTNCLKISDIHRDKNTGAINFLENKYYARGVGLVKSVRELPVNQAHTAQLVKYNSLAVTNILNESIIPESFILFQNYPNPFNPITTIKYELPQSSFVSLKVYDILGKEVATLENENKNAGRYEVTFDGSNLSSGIYIYQIRADNFTKTNKLILMK